MKKIDVALDEYATFLKKEGYSSRTIGAYSPAIRDFAAFCKIDGVEQITGEKLKAYRDHVNEQSWSPKTKNVRLIPIRRFVDYLKLAVPIGELRLFRDKNGKKPLDLITYEELQTYLKHKDNPRNDFMVNFLYATGLRVSEMCALNLEDITEEFEICGKGGRERKVFVPASVLRMFETYRAGLPVKTGPLFLGMTVRNVQKIVKERAEYVLPQGKKVTPHTLRHLYATHLYENGADIRTLQQMLGHASMNTTQIYAHVSTERMREAAKLLQKKR